MALASWGRLSGSRRAVYSPPWSTWRQFSQSPLDAVLGLDEGNGAKRTLAARAGRKVSSGVPIYFVREAACQALGASAHYLMATQFPFTHAGIICSQDGAAGAVQVAHSLCAAEFRLLTKLEDIVLGSGMLQFHTQRLFSATRTQSELFLHPRELYLVSMEARIEA